MTTAQIVALARKKMLEETSEIVDDETILIYANLTKDDLVKRSFPESAVLSANVVFTSGVGALPASFGTLYGDAQEYGTVDQIYPELSINDFRRLTSGYGLTVEGGSMYIYPAVNKTLTVRYWPTSVDLVLTPTPVNPAIDPYLHELIVYGILYRVFEDLQDEELSKYYRDKYEEEFAQKRSALSEYEEGNQRGGQLFNGISIVSDNGPFTSW